MLDATVTVVGNLVADPQLAYLPDGTPVARLRLAHTPRVPDLTTGQWRDGDPLYLTCVVWRQQAGHVADSLRKGQRVLLAGRLRSREFTGDDGTRRVMVELEVEEIGPSLRFGAWQAQPGGLPGRPEPSPPPDPVSDAA